MNQEQYQNLINTFINIQSKDYYIFLYLEVRFNEAEVVRNEYLKEKILMNQIYLLEHFHDMN